MAPSIHSYPPSSSRALFTFFSTPPVLSPDKPSPLTPLPSRLYPAMADPSIARAQQIIEGAIETWRANGLVTQSTTAALEDGLRMLERIGGRDAGLTRATVLRNMCRLYHVKDGDFASAFRCAERALSVVRGLDQSSASVLEEHARCLVEVGEGHGHSGRMSEATIALKEALPLTDEAGGLAVKILVLLSRLSLMVSEYTDAASFAQRAEAANVTAHWSSERERDLANIDIAGVRGSALTAISPSDGLAHYHRKLALCEKLHGQISKEAASTLNSIGLCIGVLGDLDGSGTLLRRARDMYITLGIGGTLDCVANNVSLANQLNRAGRASEALSLGEETLLILGKVLPSDHPAFEAPLLAISHSNRLLGRDA